MTSQATAHAHPRAALAPLLLALCLSAQAAPRAEAEMPMPALPASKARAPVTLNFVNAEVEMVSRAIAAMLDRQIIVDPRVKGQVTITSEKALPPQEAWRSYLAALRGLGFAVVESGGLLKVVPEAEAKLQTGTVQIGAATVRGDQILTQIFRLNHENPNNLVAVLRPLISANNTINANPGNSSLVITDYADNLQRLGKIIAALDQPAASEVEVVPLRHALASDLAPIVQKLSDGAGAAAVPGAPATQGGGGTTILVEPRSNSLILRTASASRMAAAKELIAKLDQPSADSGPAGSIHVVYLKNADATKLAEVLRAVLASASSTGGAGGASTSAGSFNPSSSGMAGNPSGANANASGAGSAAATTPVAQSARPSTGGQIQADPSTNSLIISAPEPQYRQLRQVIDQLDTRRAQIYVESLIVKVDASKVADFGIQWQGLLANKGNTTGLVGGTNFGATGNIINLSTAAAGLGGTSTGSSVSLGQGLNVGLINKVQGVFTLASLAHFLETTSGGNVLSTPNLVALDNEEAKIVIGENRPFVTGSFTNTGTGSNGAVNPFQTVERKDVGITLRIKSQIGEGGTVRMTVYQESSSIAANDNQVTQKSAIETTVVVDSGQTMVLGGLLKDEYGDGEGRVPGLASIPILGNLFRNENRSRVKSNLMLFLRPVVLRSQADADSLTVDRYDAIRAEQTSRQPAPTLLLPVGDAPVLPELKDGKPVTPLSLPASAPAQ